ncbi:ATP-binding protein [Algoriphagus halophilus]
MRISKEYLTYLTTGGTYTPNFDQEFPACKVETEQEWSDLIVNESVMEGVIEIKNWLEHGYKLKSAFDFGRRIKPGFKVLFTGPPGTGKTLTASLLGKSCQMDVYRVDLSMVVSKYIGETEKIFPRYLI